VCGWLQVNATTVVRRKVKVLCVMAFEQPLTNRAPPALELIQGAALTPTHHILVNGVWGQARGTGVAAVRPLTARPASVLEVLDGEIITRYHFHLGYSTRWVYSLAMYQPGNFQLDNGM